MIIKNGNVVTPDKVLFCTDIRLENGKIAEIGKELTGGDAFDATGLLVCPGFVDIHTHGGYGCDFMDEDDAAFEKALCFHSDNGTTSLLATSVTAPVQSIMSMLKRTERFMKKEDKICRVLGAHIEGPYISLKNKGAQKAEYLRVPSKDDYSFILKNNSIVKKVTIAPELDGAYEMIRKLKEKGITVSCGHDDALTENIYNAVSAGMTNCTHWYCAMSNAKVVEGKRSVGLTEIGLIDDRITLELLADNHHLPPELVKLAYKCKGADKLCLVSDCLRAGGMPQDGKVYTLGASDDGDTTKFIVSDGVARLTDGTRFAGSIQPVRRMVKNIVEDANIPLTDAVRMASLTPAEIIGMEREIGSLETGKRADIAVIDCRFEPVITIIDGKIIKKHK